MATVLSPHDLAFEVRVAVVFAGSVVQVLAYRFVRREFFKPLIVVLVQARFVVVDENRRGDVHRVY